MKDQSPSPVRAWATRYQSTADNKSWTTNVSVFKNNLAAEVCAVDRGSFNCYRNVEIIPLCELRELEEMKALNASLMTKNPASCCPIDNTEIVVRELAQARGEIENLAWNLGGCSTYAMGYDLDKEHSTDLARPALNDVKTLALNYQELKEAVKWHHAGVLPDEDESLADSCRCVLAGDEWPDADKHHAQVILNVLEGK